MLWKTAEYSGWGRVHTAQGDIARPERASTLAKIMAETPAPAFGNRRSYGDSPLNDGGRAIDMTRMDKVLAFDPETGVVEAEAGIRLGELMRLFAPRGWTPAVVPGTGFCTLGGAIANDVHGKNHHVAGSFGDHLTPRVAPCQAPRLTDIRSRPHHSCNLFAGSLPCGWAVSE